MTPISDSRYDMLLVYDANIPDTDEMVQRFVRAMLTIQKEIPLFFSGNINTPNIYPVQIFVQTERDMVHIQQRLCHQFPCGRITFDGPRVDYRERVHFDSPQAFVAEIWTRKAISFTFTTDANDGTIFIHQPDNRLTAKDGQTIFDVLRQSFQNGWRYHFPLIGFQVAIRVIQHNRLFVGGKNQLEETSQQFIDKIQSTTLVEPIVAVNIQTPESYVDAIQGQLSQHGADYENWQDGELWIVASLIRMQAFIGFDGWLRTATQDQARYTLKLAGYEPVPEHELPEDSP